MEILINVSISLGFAVFYGIWRRCYGGWDSFIWKRLFPKHGSALHRNFWRIIGLGAIFSISYFHMNMEWYWALYASLVMQFIFWDWTFGMYMGIGRHSKPLTEDDIDEYNRQLFAPLMNWLTEDDDRYNEFYDYLGMSLRFFIPGFLFAISPCFDIRMCIMGVLFPMIYLTGIRIHEKGLDGNFFMKNFTELVAGFVTGFAMSFV